MISEDQFGELAKQVQPPDAGFSVNPVTGRSPRSGIMVSRAGTEHAIRPPQLVKGRDIQSYAQTHEAALKPRGKYLGGWHDPKQHQVDLDVSKRYSDRTQAIRAMVRHDQWAGYDVGKNYVMPNWAKTGTADTALGKIVTEDPDSDFYQNLRDSLKPGKAPLPGFLKEH